MTTTTIKTVHCTVLLIAGVLTGASLPGCDPKTIGAETESAGDTGNEDTGNEVTGATGYEDTGSEETGGACVDGDMMPASDGCNTCSCLEGQWACTQIGCGDEAPPEPECMEGDEKMEDCNSCFCYEGGWACTDIGCSATDTIDPTGQTSDDTGSDDSATEPGSYCGDGVVSGAEQCDDGNQVDGDGCSSVCESEDVGACMDKPQDGLSVLAAAIEGDSLVLDVSYGGGCEDHEIGTCWDGAFAESDPVQVWVDLWHDAHDDPCDAIVEEQRVLDLVFLKEAWQAAYQQQSGTITVHLEGWPESLAYTF